MVLNQGSRSVEHTSLLNHVMEGVEDVVQDTNVDSIFSVAFASGESSSNRACLTSLLASLAPAHGSIKESAGHQWTPFTLWVLCHPFIQKTAIITFMIIYDNYEHCFKILKGLQHCFKFLALVTFVTFWPFTDDAEHASDSDPGLEVMLNIFTFPNLASSHCFFLKMHIRHIIASWWITDQPYALNVPNCKIHAKTR